MPFKGSSRSNSPASEPVADIASLAPKALSNLVYHSRAVELLSDSDLDCVITSAQARNQREGVTGVMIYDRGRLMQWLEGPSAGLQRVWQSIRHDRRHTGISLLGQSIAAVRVFGSSAMTFALRKGSASAERSGYRAIHLPTGLIDALFERPESAPAVLEAMASHPEEGLQQRAGPNVARVGDVRASLQLLVNTRILPELLARQGAISRRTPVLVADIADLAHSLLAADPAAAFALIDRLRDDGPSITQLCSGVFEPAARALGDLWQSDHCSELQVELGLANLQIALRRAGSESSSGFLPHLWHPHSVLVAPSPRESHLLGSVIASEIFGRAGWDVHAEFPESDAALSRLVHDQWFDVLDLSLSASFQRINRLPALAASISAAHASSRNPGLIVMVNGRIFNEQPLAYIDVGADVGSSGADDLEVGARSLLQYDTRMTSRGRA